jgi:segregation and condensation protein B
MSPEQIVEATLFASQTPLTPEELARADESLSAERVLEALQKLRQRYDDEEHAFQVYQLADGYQILTRPEYAPYLERFDSIPRSPILSQAALETLAIIAYRQPLGRIEIEDIRGVGCSTVLRTLQDWELIQVVGRAEGLGRPHLYGTSRRFLEHFGFQSLAELPRPDDLPIALRAAVTAEPEPSDEPGEGEVEAERHGVLEEPGVEGGQSVV